MLSRHRQTVFYTPSTITVSEGQKVTGHVSCSPNAKNNRDLDIAISYQTGNDAKDTHIQYKMCVTSVLSSLHTTMHLCVCIWLCFWSADRLSGLDWLIHLMIQLAMLLPITATPSSKCAFRFHIYICVIVTTLSCSANMQVLISLALHTLRSGGNRLLRLRCYFVVFYRPYTIREDLQRKKCNLQPYLLRP